MRICLFEPLDVGCFVVGYSVVPAAKDDSLPLVGESTLGHLGCLAFLFEELIVGRRPPTLLDRKPCELVERLPEELRASPTARHETLLTALCRQRRDARGCLE